MKIYIVLAAVVSVILFVLHWVATRVLNITLKPFVNMMMRFCMPTFFQRFLMQ